VNQLAGRQGTKRGRDLKLRLPCSGVSRGSERRSTPFSSRTATAGSWVHLISVPTCSSTRPARKQADGHRARPPAGCVQEAVQTVARAIDHDLGGGQVRWVNLDRIPHGQHDRYLPLAGKRMTDTRTRTPSESTFGLQKKREAALNGQRVIVWTINAPWCGSSHASSNWRRTKRVSHICRAKFVTHPNVEVFCGKPCRTSQSKRLFEVNPLPRLQESHASLLDLQENLGVG
jgi:hypothetical protein